MNDLSYSKPSDDFVNRRSNTFAVAIYLPQNLDKICQTFREKYDPLVAIVPAHITIVFPFNTNRTVDQLSGLIKRVTMETPAFDIELTSIGDFYPESPVIFWKIRNHDTLCDLYFRLYAALDIPIPFKVMIPHVTLAREISNHRVITVKDKIVSYLPEERFEATSLDLLTPLVNERWVSVRSFPFKI